MTLSPYIHQEKGNVMAEKSLGNTDINGTRKNVPDVVVYGDGDTFALWLKASSQSEGWLKSSKVANVPGGCLVQTEIRKNIPMNTRISHPKRMMLMTPSPSLTFPANALEIILSSV